ncbi:site-specific DNA-methyltransferase [Thermophilibacter sp. ZX-H10]|uniref:site-specific DNA-methyltransferase n=1 Tax=unclassified Thermophilibacter TaxID=2847308 RepID=UPI0040408CE7
MPTLNWMGKEKVVNHHRDVPYRVLERVPEKGVLDSQGSDCGNMVIHGDNLEALKALLPEYEGKVDCIYIDPPYNTGNENWAYNDNVNDPRIKKWFGEVVGKEGEDFSRHDKWLCMMYPRLQLLRKLLAPTGAIFISIDDNEQANLKMLCDEVFGQRNFIADIIWQKRTSPDARKRMSNGHEYILLYSKDATDLTRVLNLMPLDEEDARKYKNPDNDPKGPWVSVDFTAQGFRPNQMYQIETPSGKLIGPPEGRCWKNLQSVYEELRAEGRLWFGESGDGVPRQKNYLCDKPGKTSWTWWTNGEVGHTQEATQELAVILGKAVFDYPKPVRLIERILQLATKPNSIVLDSFAGSGTTAHALMKLNEEDGGHRRFILVELSDYADTTTAERIRRVIAGYGEGSNAVEGIDSGFSYYELGPALFRGDGTLSPDVTRADLARYVWATETRAPYEDLTDEHPYLLGEHAQAVYYLAWEPGEETALTYDLLRGLPHKGTPTVIYADRCAIAPERLDEMGVVFKRVPDQIARI